MTTHPEETSRPAVHVRVSARRKKTVAAHWEGDRIVVVVPTHVRGAERDRIATELADRLIRGRPHLHSSDLGLEARAHELADRYLDGVRPASIRWSGRQKKRWGSCTLTTREIRISERLRAVPTWVLDAVIVHELTHLLEANHSQRFRAIERRYPRMEEADTFLAGYSLGLNQDGAWSMDGEDGPEASAFDRNDTA